MLRFLILIFSLLPGLALAQANIFEPVAGDKSMMVLGSLFGGLGTFGSSGVDPFLAGINAFNSAAEQTLDHSYGSGAGKLAMSIGGEVGSADYNRAVNAFQTKASNLMSGGASADQAKDMISGMVSTENSRFESEGGNIKNILKEESGKLTAGFGGSNNSTQQKEGDGR